MNKKYFVLMGIAAMFAACSSNELKEDIKVQETAIEFGGYTNRTSRAEIKNEKALGLAGGFAVYGYKYKTDLAWADPWWNETTVKNVIFKNVNVTTTAAESDAETKTDYAWTYSGTKYWDKTADYKFYAIAPYEGTPNYSIDKDGKFNITGVASGLAADSKDYVIDRVVNEVAASTSHSAVEFDFHHIMTKVDFLLKMSDDLNDADVVKVTSVEMSGWNKATGTFAQSKVDGTWGALDCTEWTLATPAVAGNVECVTAETTLSKTAAATNTNTFIMVPQDIAASTLTFTLNYTVNDEPFTAQTGAVTTAQKWGTDSHFTYTITVGPEAIKFDVTSVCDFCVSGEGDATIN